MVVVCNLKAFLTVQKHQIVIDLNQCVDKKACFNFKETNCHFLIDKCVRDVFNRTTVAIWKEFLIKNEGWFQHLLRCEFHCEHPMKIHQIRYLVFFFNWQIKTNVTYFARNTFWCTVHRDCEINANYWRQQCGCQQQCHGFDNLKASNVSIVETH